MMLFNKYLNSQKIVIFSILFSFVWCQEIPNEFLQFQVQKLRTDAGEDWERNTIFGPLRFNYGKNITDSLKVQTRFGAYVSTNAIALYGFGHFTFKSHFHGYLYPRVVNQPELFDRFSGIPRDIERAGFSSGEIDLSGISYENHWMILQFGRGRQSWGAGNNIQLAMSEFSPAYEYGMLDLDFGKLKVRYLHGFLETDTLSYNRYITGRGIEWNNQKSLVFGLSEIIIYSGQNRPIDFAYFNPISTHLEIELNERQNQSGHDNGNGVWQASIDWLIKEHFRISGNILFDEFTIDKDHEFEEGEGHSNAVSIRAVWSPKVVKQMYTSFFTEYIMVGTHTLRHQSGYNNFVQRGLPLGWWHGSDGDQYRVGLNIFNNTNLITQFSFGDRRSGEETITIDPYEPYPHFQEVPFPSGRVIKTKFISGDLQWWWKKNVSLMAGLEWLDSDKDGQEFSFHIGFDMYYLNSFKL